MIKEKFMQLLLFHRIREITTMMMHRSYVPAKNNVFQKI